MLDVQPHVVADISNVVAVDRARVLASLDQEPSSTDNSSLTVS